MTAVEIGTHYITPVRRARMFPIVIERTEKEMKWIRGSIEEGDLEPWGFTADEIAGLREQQEKWEQEHT